MHSVIARHELSDGDLRRLRTASQCLGASSLTALKSVRRLVGVQAQDSAAAALNIRARSGCADRTAVDAMIGGARSLVRTWAMRGTLHMLAANDVHWLVASLGPRFAARYRASRLALGLTDELLERAIDAMPAVLRASAPVTRFELTRRIVEAGVRIARTGQAPAHLVMAAALQGLLCCGPDAAGGKSTYVLLDDWIPGPKRTPQDPLGELASRYLEGHGPATAADFAGWSGLPANEARHAVDRVAADFEEVRIQGERAWFRPANGPRGDSVRLVGGFDAYLLAYRQRRFAVDPQHAARVHPGGGIIRPFVLVDGKVEGTWRARKGRVAVEMFGKTRHSTDQEVDHVERFLSRAGA